MAARGRAATGGPSSSSTGTAGADPAPAWVTSVVDALASAERQFSPEVAREVVAVMDHYPTLLEAMARFATAIGTRSVETADMPPGSQTIFLELGSMQQRMLGPVRDALVDAKRSVMDRINRYQANRPQDRAWDVRANQDTPK